jgi:hypothetical protein
MQTVTTDQALADVFLRRLKRVLLLRFYTDNLLTDGDRRLLDHAIYSSYCDAQALGVGDEARRLLNEARAGGGVFKRPLAVGR